MSYPDFSSDFINERQVYLNSLDWSKGEEDLEADELYPRNSSILSETIGNRFGGGMECQNVAVGLQEGIGAIKNYEGGIS